MNIKNKGFEETKEHWTRLFPFNIYPCTIPYDFPSVPLHWHKNVELVYVKKGVGQVQISQSTYTVEAGDIVFLPPGTLHALKHIAEQSMEYENIIFDVHFLGDGAADICTKEYLVPLSSGRLLQPVLIHPSDDIYNEVSSCLIASEALCSDCIRGYELGVKSAMIQLIFLLLRNQKESPEPENADIKRLRDVLKKIESEYNSLNSVDEMADYCGCSSSHFMRWFKKMTGTSFINYLGERKLAAAAEMLRETDEKIVTIAENTGYDNLSNFNRQFKKRYGVTPSGYRKK